MKETTGRSTPVFVTRVTIIHVVTYLLFGILASTVLDYESVFEQPVIRDYMVEFGSIAIYLGPVIQVVRGLVFAAVLLPFRATLAARRLGWLYLWLLIVGLGIISTPAAAPSSIEGVVYTVLPLWYHFFGLPEMLLQTLLFSVLVHAYLRHPAGILQAMPPVFSRMVRALAGASFAFIGYAIVSIGFALAAGASITAESNLDLRVQGLFIAPFLLNFLIAMLVPAVRRVPPIMIFGVAYLGNVAVLLLYQAIILTGPDPLYALVAPLLPAAIVAWFSRRDDSRPAERLG